MTRLIAGLVAALGVAVVAYNVVHLDDFSVFALIPLSLSPFLFMGALLIARVPRNAVGWLLTGSGILFALAFVGGEYATVALVNDPGRLPGGEIGAAFSQGAFPGAIGLTVLLLLFFPSGRGLGGRWTWVERALVAFTVLLAFVDLCRDVPVQIGPMTSDAPQAEIPNALAFPGAFGQLVTTVAQVVDKTSTPLALAAPLSLFIRFRRSSTTEREQIKWLAYTGTVALALLVIGNSVPSDWGNVLWPLNLVALGTLPVAIAVAIFRYHLYDIDLLIRRTLVYGTVSAILLVAYVGGVGVFESLLAPFTAGNGIAVAVSTLGVVALFQPVRRRIQSAVDHRFFRAKYDAQRTLDAFATRLRDEVDLDTLERELLGAARDTVQPAHATVWLRPARNDSRTAAG